MSQQQFRRSERQRQHEPQNYYNRFNYIQGPTYRDLKVTQKSVYEQKRLKCSGADEIVKKTIFEYLGMEAHLPKRKQNSRYEYGMADNMRDGLIKHKHGFQFNPLILIDHEDDYERQYFRRIHGERFSRSPEQMIKARRKHNNMDSKNIKQLRSEFENSIDEVINVQTYENFRLLSEHEWVGYDVKAFEKMVKNKLDIFKSALNPELREIKACVELYREYRQKNLQKLIKTAKANSEDRIIVNILSDLFDLSYEKQLRNYFLKKEYMTERLRNKVSEKVKQLIKKMQSERNAVNTAQLSKVSRIRKQLHDRHLKQLLPRLQNYKYNFISVIQVGKNKREPTLIVKDSTTYFCAKVAKTSLEGDPSMHPAVIDSFIDYLRFCYGYDSLDFLVNSRRIFLLKYSQFRAMAKDPTKFFNDAQVNGVPRDLFSRFKRIAVPVLMQEEWFLAVVDPASDSIFIYDPAIAIRKYDAAAYNKELDVILKLMKQANQESFDSSSPTSMIFGENMCNQLGDPHQNKASRNSGIWTAFHIYQFLQSKELGQSFRDSEAEKLLPYIRYSHLKYLFAYYLLNNLRMGLHFLLSELICAKNGNRFLYLDSLRFSMELTLDRQKFKHAFPLLPIIKID